jgi:hypothetical protein
MILSDAVGHLADGHVLLIGLMSLGRVFAPYKRSSLFRRNRKSTLQTIFLPEVEQKLDVVVVQHFLQHLRAQGGAQLSGVSHRDLRPPFVIKTCFFLRQ